MEVFNCIKYFWFVLKIIMLKKYSKIDINIIIFYKFNWYNLFGFVEFKFISRIG